MKKVIHIEENGRIRLDEKIARCECGCEEFQARFHLVADVEEAHGKMELVSQIEDVEQRKRVLMDDPKDPFHYRHIALSMGPLRLECDGIVCKRCRKSHYLGIIDDLFIDGPAKSPLRSREAAHLLSEQGGDTVAPPPGPVDIVAPPPGPVEDQVSERCTVISGDDFAKGVEPTDAAAWAYRASRMVDQIHPDSWVAPFVDMFSQAIFAGRVAGRKEARDLIKPFDDNNTANERETVLALERRGIMPDENDIAIGGGTPTAAGPIEQMASQAVHPEAQPAEPVPEKAGNPAQGPDPATEAAPVEDRKIPYSEMPLDQIPWPVCGKCEFRRGKRGLCFGGPPQVAPRALVPAPQKVATPGQPRPHVFYYQTMRPQVDERDIACGFFQPKFEPQELVDMAAKAQKAEQSGDIPTAGEAPHKHEEGCAHEEQRA